jgi:hypothetical protein
VFEQEEDVADFFFFAEGDQLLLELQAGGVVDGAELEDRDQILVAADLQRSKSKAFTTEATEGHRGVHRSFTQKARSG